MGMEERDLGPRGSGSGESLQAFGWSDGWAGEVCRPSSFRVNKARSKGKLRPHKGSPRAWTVMSSSALGCGGRTENALGRGPQQGAAELSRGEVQAGGLGPCQFIPSSSLHCLPDLAGLLSRFF